MTIRYRGEVRTLTSDLALGFAAIAAGRVPPSVPLAGGMVEVRPIGATAPIVDGTFSVAADTPTETLSAYRLVVSTRLGDPCATVRDRLRQARNRVEVARRDGQSRRAVELLERTVIERQQEVDRCEERTGHSAATVDRDVAVFRSGDLYRTPRGAHATVSGLEVYWKVLDGDDREGLDELGVTFPFDISNGELLAMVQASVRPPVVVRRARTEDGLVRIDFHHDDYDVSGHIRVEIEPSRSRTFTRLIEMRLVDFDTSGVTGEIGERLGLVEWRLQNAVEAAANRLNGRFGAGLQALAERDVTLTVLDVGELDDGIRLSCAAGLLAHSPADPCQLARNRVQALVSQVHAAELDGSSDLAISLLGQRLDRARVDLARCESPRRDRSDHRTRRRSSGIQPTTGTRSPTSPRSPRH